MTDAKKTDEQRARELLRFLSVATGGSATFLSGYEGRVVSLIQAVRAERDAELAVPGARLTDDESRRLENRLCAHGGGAAVSIADRLTIAVCLQRLRQYDAAIPSPPPVETKECQVCGRSRLVRKYGEIYNCPACTGRIPTAGGEGK